MSEDSLSDPWRVESLLALNRYDEARTMARSLLAGSPGDVRLLRQITVASIQLRDHRMALEDAKQLLAAAPDDGFSHELMGVALFNRRQHKQAIAEVQRAVALDPSNPSYRLRLSDFLVEYAAVGPTVVRQAPLRREAARQAFAARQLAPDQPEPHLALARAGLALGDRDGAREAVEHALAIDPQNHRAHQLLGEVELAGGKRSKAGDHFLDAGRLQPHDPTTIALLNRASGRPLLLTAGFVCAFAFVRSALDGQPLIGLAIGVVVFSLALIVSMVMTARLSPEARAALKRDRSMRRRT